MFSVEYHCLKNCVHCLLIGTISPNGRQCQNSYCNRTNDSHLTRQIEPTEELTCDSENNLPVICHCTGRFTRSSCQRRLKQRKRARKTSLQQNLNGWLIRGRDKYARPNAYIVNDSSEFIPNRRTNSNFTSSHIRRRLFYPMTHKNCERGWLRSVARGANWLSACLPVRTVCDVFRCLIGSRVFALRSRTNCNINNGLKLVATYAKINR